LDVIEIDAASNRGIDEIRNLKENIRVSPSLGRYKIYIIDEAHMLTGAAFNALLKTLEEPPEHAIIILATTEYEKVPSTISSRCQRFPFRRLPKSDIVKKLENIVKSENLNASQEVLSIIASAAEGSLRDAESLLDQLSATGTLSVSAAESLLGRVGSQRVETLALHIAEKNMPAAAAYIAQLDNEGVNMTPFTKDLIHYLRKALTLRLAPAARSIIAEEHTDNELKTLENIAGKLSEADGVRVLRSLIRAYSEMRYSPLGSIPLEVVLTEQLT
jgi:DNA polymerase-3 subunit gamma/tau